MNSIRELNSPTAYTGQIDGWSMHVQCKPSRVSGLFRRYPATEILAAMLYTKI